MLIFPFKNTSGRITSFSFFFFFAILDFRFLQLCVAWLQVRGPWVWFLSSEHGFWAPCNVGKPWSSRVLGVWVKWMNALVKTWRYLNFSKQNVNWTWLASSRAGFDSRFQIFCWGETNLNKPTLELVAGLLEACSVLFVPPVCQELAILLTTKIDDLEHSSKPRFDSTPKLFAPSPFLAPLF